MLLLYLSVIGVIVAYATYRYFTRTFNYWKQRNVVGPDPVVLFGNLKESTLRNMPFALAIKNIYDSYPNEKFVGIYRLTTPCLLIRDLDIIKQIMIKDFDYFIDRGVEFSKEGLGANMFHSDGDTWRVLRSTFSPIFTSGKLKNMMYLMTEQADTFLEHMKSVCCKQPEQEVHSLVQKFTIASIASCAFGLDIDLLKDSMNLMKKLDDLIFRTNYANELDMMYPGILKNLNASLFPSEVTAFFNNLVKRVIQLRNGKPTNRRDFMDLILEMRQRGEIQGSKRNDNTKLRLELTDDLIAAQAFVFYAGGYETSATTLTYMLYELALNLSIQDKLTNEIDQVLENNDGELTYDVLNEMTYLDKVFNETLRKYSLVDPLQRNAKMDYTIPGTNLTIKKGQTVLVSINGVHRDEKYYPNPEVFDPERFDRGNAQERHSCAYLPFGVGPRNCIGSRFAKLQSRVCVVKILSKFRVVPSKNTKRIMKFDPYRIVMSPKGGEYLSFVPRE